MDTVTPPGMTIGRIGLAASVLLVLPLMSGCTLIVPSYRHDLEAAHKRIDSGSQVADTRCGPIEYAISGQGPPLLVVHGAGGGFDQGLIIGAPLIKAGYQVIAVSRFGYLGTPLPADASPAAQADAYSCLLNVLDIPRADVLGVSAGVPSALQFALRHPDQSKALVLLVPMVFAPHPEKPVPAKHPLGGSFVMNTVLRSDFLVWLAPHLSQATVEKAMGTPSTAVEHASPEEQARVKQMIDQILPVGPRRPGLLNDMKVIGSLQRYDLEQVAVPTLVIGTFDDLYGTYDAALYTAVHIPKARFIGYSTGGHMMVGRQDETRDAIVTFFKGQGDAQPSP